MPPIYFLDASTFLGLALLMGSLYSLSCLMSLIIIMTGAIAVDADSFREGSTPRVLTELQCDGEELEVLECPHTLFQGFSCATSAVICQG